jgi:adenylate cyclase
MTERAKRRLAAIVAMDVAGYSRLIEADEEGTLRALHAHRREALDLMIAEHNGRVANTAGDSLLLEFTSSVDAVRFARLAQLAMIERNREIEQDRQISFRIGINVGDVVVEGDDLLGDGVNIAARLEALADTGGICLSGETYRQVRGKLDADFEDLGERQVKNIDQPVHVWRWSPTGSTSIGAINVSEPVPGFDGRPAIAVLAFNNLSQDSEQEFLADGIAEDILTRLAMWRWLPVIARNSGFAYKGRAIDLKKVGLELGARYVLEGSVRKAGNRVRITGQLIDTETGYQAWGGRYDRELEDIFTVQDEITDAIVAALEPAVGRAEMQRAHRKKPENLDAWDCYQRGMWYLSKVTERDLERANEMFQQSVEADAKFAPPLAGIGLIGFLNRTIGFSSNWAARLATAHEAAQRAARLDELDPFAQAALGYTSTMSGDYDAGIASAQRAVGLNPSFALGYHCLHAATFMACRFQESMDAVQRACRISPSDPWLFFFLAGVSGCHYMMREYEPAVEAAKIAVARYSKYSNSYRWLAISLAQLDRIDEAQEAMGKFLDLSPNAPETARHAYPLGNEGDLAHYLDGLRKAGLPD